MWFSLGPQVQYGFESNQKNHQESNSGTYLPSTQASDQ